MRFCFARLLLHLFFQSYGIAGEQATYSFFGEDTALPGDWKQEDALNVGKAYVSGGQPGNSVGLRISALISS
ncbi:MAG: hypothetical protein ACLR56_14115 [Oscillospiraceae bacterium]